MSNINAESLNQPPLEEKPGQNHQSASNISTQFSEGISQQFNSSNDAEFLPQVPSAEEEMQTHQSTINIDAESLNRSSLEENSTQIHQSTSNSSIESSEGISQQLNSSNDAEFFPQASSKEGETQTHKTGIPFPKKIPSGFLFCRKFLLKYDSRKLELKRMRQKFNGTLPQVSDELRPQFKKCSILQTSDFQPLLSSIRQFPGRLRKIDFSFHDFNKIDSAFFQILFGSSRKLKYLSFIGLEPNYKIDIHRLRATMPEMRSLSVLSELKLNFSECSYLRDNELDCIIKRLRHFKKLFSFSLKFANNLGCRANTIEKLFVVLGKMEKLSTLELFFKHVGSESDQDVDIFSKLSNLSKLRTLYLNISDSSHPTDQALKTLSSIIRYNLIHVTDLNLSFKTCNKISHEGLSALYRELGNYTKLTALVLDFRSCDNLKKANFSELLNAIGKLKLLEKLGLGFSEIEDLGDARMEDLASTLSNLQQLSSLKLDLSFFRPVSDKGIIAFRRELTKLDKSLTELDLTFDSCNITSEGAQHLALQGKKAEKTFFLERK